jgi:hypothetical protein
MVNLKCHMLLSEITDIDTLKWNEEVKPEENNPIIASTCHAHRIRYLRIYFKPTTLLDVVAIILLYQ